MGRFQSTCFLLILQLSSFGCAQEVQNPLLKQVVDAADTRIGSLDLRGRVVSADGQLMQDVTVVYFFREFGDVLARKEVDRKSMNVDGHFRIKKRNVSSANLWIAKEGFYPERWSFVFDENTPQENPGGFERLDIEIVLFEVPSPAPLEKFEGVLRTSSTAPVSVLFSKKRLFPRMGKEKEEQILLDFSWPNIYLAVENAADGSIHTREQVPDNKRSPIDVLAKGWIRLSQPDPGDGFIIYDPGEVPPREKLAFRGMLEAPLEGYSSDLEILTSGSPRKVFFYCRVHGQYGKGMVSGRPAIVIEEDCEDCEIAVAGIVVFLNPTGSRDVSYVHN